MTAPATSHSGWLGVVVTVAGIALMALVVLAIPELRQAVDYAVQGDIDALRAEVHGLGFAGVMILEALILIHAVVFYPSEIANAVAGLLYGFWLGMAIVMPGWIASALLAYLVGRAAGRPLLQRLAGLKRFERAERAIERGGVTALLVARLIPIMPFSIVGYVAGAARVPLWRYTWTTAIGFLPLCAALVYAGERLESLTIDDPIVIGGVLLVIVLFVAAHRLARRIGTEK